jgi:hypothetical protein
MPEMGHTREDLTERPVKFWSVFSYLVVYDPASRPLTVLAVLHGARRWAPPQRPRQPIAQARTYAAIEKRSASLSQSASRFHLGKIWATISKSLILYD